jgi:hypothetical protein
MKKSLLIALALAASGCAFNYEPPVSLSPSKIEKLARPKTEVFNAAKRALVANGYQITDADEPSGTISTAPRDLRLSPVNADCGTTLGLDYLLDNRTATRVAFGVIVGPGDIEVKATVQGDYRPGDPSQDITLTCVSKGLLENDMLNKIKSEIR